MVVVVVVVVVHWRAGERGVALWRCGVEEGFRTRLPGTAGRVVYA